MAWPRAPLIIPLCVVFVLVALLCLIFFKLIQILTRRPNKRESYEVEKGVYEEGAMTTLSRRGRQKPQGLIPYTIDPGSSSSNIVKRSASPLYPAVLTGAAVLGGMATGAALRTTINGSDEEDEDERAGRNQADERYTDLDTVDEATEDAAGIVQFLGEPSSSSSQHHQASSYSMRTMDMNTTNSSASTEAHYNNRHEVAYDTHYYGGASSGAGDHYESDV